MKIMNPILGFTVDHSLWKQPWFLGATLVMELALVHIPRLTPIVVTDGA